MELKRVSSSGIVVRLLAAVIGLAVAIEGTISILNYAALPLEDRYYQNGETAWVTKLPRKPKMLFMGSSTMLFGVDPTIVAAKLGMDSGEVLNLAGAGYTPIHSLHVWQSGAGSFDSVRYVFYGLDSWLFSERKFQRDDWLTLGWSFPQRLWIASHKSFHPYVRNYCLTAIPWLHVMVDCYWKHDTLHSDAPAAFGGETQFLRAWDPWTVPSKDLYPQSLFPMSDLCFARLRALSDSVAKHGAKLVFVLPPKHKAWLADYEQNCRDYDSLFVTRLNRELGPHLVLGSFRMFSAIEDSTVLLDYVHMNKEGQRRFSSAITDSIRSVMYYEPRVTPVRPLWSY